MNNRIAIIGAGISGLTCAILLSKSGKNIQIYESYPELRSSGLGIWIGINAMQVFGKIGIAEKILSKSHILEKMLLYNKNHVLLTKIVLKRHENKFHYPLVCLKRPDLQEILFEKIPSHNILFDKKITELKSKNNKVELYFNDLSSSEANFVIGADGVYSNCRNSIHSNFKVMSNSKICYRGITNYSVPSEMKNSGVEFWGDGSLFGFAPLGNNSIFWWAICNNPIVNSKFIVDKEILANTFNSFPNVINDLINSYQEKFQKTNLYNVSILDYWHKKNICLIGDAAHFMDPNLGLGGSTAIETAFYLSHKINTSLNIEKAFENFEKDYKNKVDFVIKISKCVRIFSELNNSTVIFFRDLIMKLTPNFISNFLLNKIYKLLK